MANLPSSSMARLKWGRAAAAPEKVDYLQAVGIINNRTHEKRVIETPAAFSFMGAAPRADWLPTEIETDAKGFVKTGMSISKSTSWIIKRQPFLLETSRRASSQQGMSAWDRLSGCRRLSEKERWRCGSYTNTRAVCG